MRRSGVDEEDGFGALILFIDPEEYFGVFNVIQ